MQKVAPKVNSGFPYKRLNDGEIRVLQLRSTSPKLAFDLTHEGIESLEYVALSYVWGDSPYSHEILVNDQQFLIKGNLYDALRQFANGVRCKASKRPLRYPIWIDAICINQGDLKERRMQARQMTNIYVKSQLVFVWLGRAQNEANNRLACEKLALFENKNLHMGFHHSSYRPWWWPNGIPVDRFAERTSKFISAASPSDKKIFGLQGTSSYNAWLGICDLWKSSWWTRCWAYQEATIPIKDEKRIVYPLIPSSQLYGGVVFICGDSSTSWTALGLAIRLAEKIVAMETPNSGFLKNASIPVQRVLAIRIRRNRPEDIELLDILQQFRLAECDDPRDKVYAPLGLVTEFFRQRITPDYEVSPLFAYTQVVKAQLKKVGRELDFLGCAMKLDRPHRVPSREISWEDWPSWVPNWDEPFGFLPLPKSLRIKNSPDRMTLGRLHRTEVYHSKVYDASAGVMPKTLAIDGPSLHLDGVFIDTIGELMGFEWTVSRKTEVLTQWRLKSATAADVNGEDFNRAVNRTRCADVRYELGSMVSRNGFLDFELLLKNRDQLSGPENQKQTDMRMAWNNATVGRALCLTSKGYIGLVPYTSKIGDKVCLFLGGDVLYVVRPKEPSGAEHIFVGECYVHTLMDGKVIQWLQCGQVTSELFVLV